MSRPALRLVEPTNRQGSAPLDFIRWAVSEFGTPGREPNHVVVVQSQAALTREYTRVSSAGTVAGYVAELRRSGVVVGTRPIIVDTSVLGPSLEAREAAADNNLAEADVMSDMPAAAAAEKGSGEGVTTLDIARDLLRQAAALTDLAQQLLANEPAETRGFRGAQPADSAETRESRRSLLAEKEGRKGNNDHPPSLLDPEPAENARGNPRDPARVNSASALELTPAEVDELVEPLRIWCLQSGKKWQPLNDDGRAVFAKLGRTVLQARVDSMIREATINPNIHSPVGLLYNREVTGASPSERSSAPLDYPAGVSDGGRAPEALRPPPVKTWSDVAEEEIRAIESDPSRQHELEELDREVRAARTPPTAAMQKLVERLNIDLKQVTRDERVKHHASQLQEQNARRDSEPFGQAIL